MMLANCYLANTICKIYLEFRDDKIENTHRFHLKINGSIIIPKQDQPQKKPSLLKNCLKVLAFPESYF